MDPAPLPESSPSNGTLGSLSDDDDDGGENVSFSMPFFCQMLVNFLLDLNFEGLALVLKIFYKRN